MTRIPHMAAIQKTILANFMAHLDDIPAHTLCSLWSELTHHGSAEGHRANTGFYGIGAGRTAEGGCPHIENLDGRMRPSLHQLFAAYCQAIDPDCGGGYCAAEFEVVGNLGDVEKKIFQIARDRDFFDRIS